MASKTAAMAAQKWARNLSASTDTIKAGVNAVTVNPMQQAAAQANAYVNGVQNAVNTGKWQAGLGRVSLQQWQQATLTKGIPRIASGATQAQPKMEQFMNQWLPYMDSLKQKLQAMPRGSIEQNKARAMATIDHNAAFKRS